MCKINLNVKEIIQKMDRTNDKRNSITKKNAILYFKNLPSWMNTKHMSLLDDKLSKAKYNNTIVRRAHGTTVTLYLTRMGLEPTTSNYNNES